MCHFFSQIISSSDSITLLGPTPENTIPTTNPACPEDTPCKGRGDEECRKAKCNRYGDSCWCETRRKVDGSANENLEEVEVEENEEYDFVEGKPEEWEIACYTGDDCPHLWYCAEKVCLEANQNHIILRGATVSSCIFV